MAVARELVGMTSRAAALGAVVAVAAAGVAVASVTSPAGGPHAATAEASAQRPAVTKGTLARRETRDTFLVRSDGQRATSEVTFASAGRRCNRLAVSLVRNGERLDVAKGRSPLTVSAAVPAARVVVRRTGERSCAAPWVARTSARPARRSPVSSAKPTAAAAPARKQQPAAPVGGTGITPLQYGAVGNGTADDTAALQRTIAALRPGGTLTLPAGRTFRHSAVLKIAVPDVTINGSGTLLATAEATSAVHLAADRITIDGPTFKMGATTKRWAAFEQMKLRLGAHSGIAVRNVVVDGSAAAGIFVGGASGFTLQNVAVRNTRADGIHMTLGSRNGEVISPVVTNPGDDGVAVVSYRNEPIVNGITVTNPRVIGQAWGRAFSVVGGSNVRYSNVYAERSAGACLYVAAEREFNTWGVSNVTVFGGQMVGCNQQADLQAADRPSPSKPRVVHGAVMFYNSTNDQAIADVTVANVQIRNTHVDGYDHIKLMSYSGQPQRRLEFRNIAITGGSRSTLQTVGVPGSAYRKIGWTQDGVAIADHVGW